MLIKSKFNMFAACSNNALGWGVKCLQQQALSINTLNMFYFCVETIYNIINKLRQ